MHPADAVYHDKSRRDRRSALKKVLDRTDDLQNVIACPYGCKGVDQDRFGYCRHLVGFVDDHKLSEGEVKKVNQEDGITIETVAAEPDEHGRRVVNGRGKLRIGDYLVRITTSLRVYRNVDLERKQPEAKQPEAKK